MLIELTGFTKIGGPLTKRISLGANEALCSDGSACVMSSRAATRLRLNTLAGFGDVLVNLRSADAIGLGALRCDLPDKVAITTKAKLEAFNGSNTLIARTGEFIQYRPGSPALALIDIDTKGMPAAVKDRFKAHGGFWPALVSVLPELADRRPRDAEVDQRRPVARRYRRTAARIERRACLCPCDGRRRRRAVPAHDCTTGAGCTASAG